MKSVALHNLGCKVNAYEIDVMQQMLQEKGFKIVPFDEQADIYVVNTCTVTNIADRKSRQMLHQAKKRNPDAVVVAVGCYVQADTEQALSDEGIDLAVGNNRKKDLAAILEAFLKERQEGAPGKTMHNTTVVNIAQEAEYEEMKLYKTAEHTRAYIKIQDGCNQFCTYCIIPYARGRVRSRKQSDILEEIKGLADAGYKEAVLTGIHISSYGIDFPKQAGEPGFLELIKRIHDTEGLERIRLGSLEPRIVSEEFVRETAKLPKICPHFHLSLQSGCGATLKRMNRRYTTEEYYEKVELLRSAFEHPAVTTDVIVGFPGETEEEFEETRAFLERICFYEMHVFKYSKRSGTPAAKMDNQISEPVKTRRSGILIGMKKEQSRAYREWYAGREIEVLFEKEKTINNTVYQVGHTREYIKAAVRSEENLSNKIRTGRVCGFLTEDILLVE